MNEHLPQSEKIQGVPVETSWHLTGDFIRDKNYRKAHMALVRAMVDFDVPDDGAPADIDVDALALLVIDHFGGPPPPVQVEKRPHGEPATDQDVKKAHAQGSRLHLKYFEKLRELFDDVWNASKSV